MENIGEQKCIKWNTVPLRDNMGGHYQTVEGLLLVDAVLCCR